MIEKHQFLWAAAFVTAGLLSGCGSDPQPVDCPDVNTNGLCDAEEPGHGKCDVADRDAQGKCPAAGPTCNGTQIAVADGCEDCPTGQIAQSNVCITPSVTCGATEIVVNDACEPCPTGQTVKDNACVDPSNTQCTGTQIAVADGCENCPTGQIAEANVCVTPTVVCGANEVIENNTCVTCGANTTATDNLCVPHCATTQVLVVNVCTDCPAGHINDGNNSCVADGSSACDSPMVVIDGVCCIDWDNDGFCAADDCNDTDSSVYPGAPEICTQRKVSDCNNACYAKPGGCTPADVFAAKDGKVTAWRSGIGRPAAVPVPANGGVLLYQSTWSSGSDLYFCGEGPFHVDLRTDASDKYLSVRSGLSDFAGAPVPILSARSEDRAVMSVGVGGNLRVFDAIVEHDAGSSITNGHGVICSRASLLLSNTTIRNNSAYSGGGVLSNGCVLSFMGDVAFTANTSELGSALYMTDGSSSYAAEARVSVVGNMGADSYSAAIYLDENSAIRWDEPGQDTRVFFSANTGSAPGQQRDLSVSHGSLFQVREATFETPGPDHVRTVGASYSYAEPVQLSCTASSCTPAN